MFQFKTISICGTIANFYKLPLLESITQKEEAAASEVSFKSIRETGKTKIINNNS